MRSAEQLLEVEQKYGLIILDRDCAIEPYHAGRIEPRFRDTLERIAGKSVILSNSSFKEFVRIGQIYGDMMPVCKMVEMSNSVPSWHRPVLLAIHKGELQTILLEDKSYRFQPLKRVNVDIYNERIVDEYTKPDPRPLITTIEWNKQVRKPENGRVLMFGDRSLVDVMCGNLAGIDTALVSPYKPLSEWRKPHLLFIVRPLDYAIGSVMSRIAGRDPLDGKTQ